MHIQHAGTYLAPSILNQLYLTLSMVNSFMNTSTHYNFLL